MGALASKAREEAESAAEAQEAEVTEMIQVLANKLEAMTLQIEATRGAAGQYALTEIAGGRSVMRVSEIRVDNNEGLDKQIGDAVGSFFNAAHGASQGNNLGAKSAAIDGAKSLVLAGIDALFGVSNGQAMEKQSFVVLFLNNSFVRVDYYIYTYSVSGKKWGFEKNKAGCCYVSDLSVLNPAELMPNEIDFLLSQALTIDQENFNELIKMKVRLVEVAVLSRALKNPTLTFKDLARITKQLGKTKEEIDKIFSSFPSAPPALNSIST